MKLTDLDGATYGPVPWRVAVDSVSDFVEVTGDDPDHWSEKAPPGFAAAALFAVAPDLLALLYEHSVIHGEQTFEWSGPLPIGDLLDVSGEVTRVRERGGVHFITFEMRAGEVLTGRSLFLASGEAIPGGQSAFERPEPPHGYRGEMGPGQVAASRADLIRYASATRDWNPVHWDHDAGIAAGFPGVVVHGLLQAAWALRAFVAAANRQPAWARFRFKAPLLPARPVSIDVDDGEVVVSDVDTEYLAASIRVSGE